MCSIYLLKGAMNIHPEARRLFERAQWCWRAHPLAPGGTLSRRSRYCDVLVRIPCRLPWQIIVRPAGDCDIVGPRQYRHVQVPSVMRAPSPAGSVARSCIRHQTRAICCEWTIGDRRAIDGIPFRPAIDTYVWQRARRQIGVVWQPTRRVVYLRYDGGWYLSLVPRS